MLKKLFILLILLVSICFGKLIPFLIFNGDDNKSKVILNNEGFKYASMIDLNKYESNTKFQNTYNNLQILDVYNLNFKNKFKNEIDMCEVGSITTDSTPVKLLVKLDNTILNTYIRTYLFYAENCDGTIDLQTFTKAKIYNSSEAIISSSDMNMSLTGNYIIAIDNDHIKLLEDTNYTIEDIDGNISIITQPLNGTVVLNDKNITYTPNPDYFGEDEFIIEYNGLQEKLDITVEPVDDSPTIEPINIETTMKIGDVKEYKINASDIDSDYLNFKLGWGPITSKNNEIIIKNSLNQDSIKFELLNDTLIINALAPIGNENKTVYLNKPIPPSPLLLKVSGSNDGIYENGTKSYISIGYFDDFLVLNEQSELTFIQSKYDTNNDGLVNDTETLPIEFFEVAKNINYDENVFGLDFDINSSNNFELYLTQGENKYPLSDYNMKILSNESNVTIKNNSILSDDPTIIDIYISVGNLSLLKSVELFPSKKNQLDISDNDITNMDKYTENQYKDTITQFNDASNYKIYDLGILNNSSFDSDIQFINKYNPTNINIDNNKTKIKYQIIEDNIIIEESEFNPTENFLINFNAIINKEYKLKLWMESDDSFDKIEYINSIYSIKKKTLPDLCLYNQKIKKNQSLQIVVPQDRTYKIELYSQNDINTTLYNSSTIYSFSKKSKFFNKYIRLKPGIYNFKIDNDSDIFLKLKYSDIELESVQDTIINALRYKNKTSLSVNSEEQDYISLQVETKDIISGKLSFDEIHPEKGFIVELLNESGHRIDRMQIDSIEMNNYNISFTSNNKYQIKEKSQYYLKFITNSNKDISYFVELDNIYKKLTRAEEYYQNIYDNKKYKSNKKNQQNLIIITGDSDNTNDPLFIASQKLSKTVYKRFKLRGFSDKDIFWLNNANSDINDDGKADDVIDEKIPSIFNTLNSITTWASDTNNTEELFIYMVDHGTNGAFKLSKNDLDNDGQREILYATKLKEAIEEFIKKTDRKVVIIIEACKSGSFIPILSSIGDKIAIITSSQAGKYSYIDKFGNVSFTKMLIDEVFKGETIYTAFENSKIELFKQGGLYASQTPMMYGSNNFLGTRVGDGITASLDPIEIINLKLNNKINAISIDLEKKLKIETSIEAVNGINKVWATIIPPNPNLPSNEEFATPNLDSYTVILDYNESSQNYQNNFLIDKKVGGTYDITVYVEDIDGFTNSKHLSVYGNSGENYIYSKTIDYGWNLVALPNSNDISTIKELDKAIIIWNYDNNEWSGYSKNSIINLKIPNKLTTTSVDKGYWILSNNSFEIGYKIDDIKNDFDSSLYDNNSWNLISTNAISDINKTFEKIKSVWKYNKGIWNVYIPEVDISEKYNLLPLNSIDSYDGVWIQK